MLNFVPIATWAWVIILGGLMLTPGGIFCIVCGDLLTRVIGVISILLGVAGFVANRGIIRR